MKILQPHQKLAHKYLGARFGGLLFMEMRLGKNLTIIRFLKERGLQDNVLIITEYGAMNSFVEELTDEGENFVALYGTKKQRLNLLENREGGWVISNYESAKKLDLDKHEWKVVILDETIKIANPKSQRTKYFLSAFKNVRLKYVLNGSPMPENLLQLCCQFLFVHGVYMGCKNYWQYRAKYFQTDSTGFEWTPKKGHIQQVDSYVHKHAFVMTREEANVGPAKHYQKRIIEMTPSQKAVQNKLFKEYAYGDAEYTNPLGVCVGLRYVAGGITPSSDHEVLSRAKINEIINIINEENPQSKFLIWCSFKEELKFICKELDKAVIPNISISGDQTQPERTVRKNLFDNDPYIKCAVLTEASCAKGQDWSSADTSIYYSREWSNDLRKQSEDRLVHLRKHYPVMIIDLLCENSVDIDVYEGLIEKSFTERLIMNKIFQKYKTKKGA